MTSECCSLDFLSLLLRVSLTHRALLVAACGASVFAIIQVSADDCGLNIVAFVSTEFALTFTAAASTSAS
jgi:hypothetical protein